MSEKELSPQINENINDIAHHGKQIQQIEDLYLDGDFDRAAIKRRISQSISLIGQEILSMGRDLIMLKENSEHGDYIDDLKELGVTRTTAFRYMSIAIKYNTPKLQQLVGSMSGVKGAFTKLLELSIEGDEDLEALIDGGTVAGLKLEAIDRMSAVELRKSLLKERKSRAEDKETHDRMITEKNDHADGLSKKLATIQGTPKPDRWPEHVLEFNQELSNYAEDTEKFLMMVIKIVESMGSQLDDETPVSVYESWAASAVAKANRLEALVAHLQNTVVENFSGFIEQPTYLLSDPLQVINQDQDES